MQNIRHLESHLVVKGLNPKGSTLSFIAPYALKSKKRFAGGALEPGGYIEVEYRPSSEGLNRLQQAHIINKFEKIRTDYDRLQLGLHFLKITSQVGLAETQEEPELFNLLGNALKALETTHDLNQLKLFFEIRFLFIQGVLPEELQNKNIFFQNTISQHQKVQLKREEFSSIQETLKHSLHNYLSC